MNFSPKASPQARQKAVAKLIDDLNADRNPIMIGPWRSELGFEVSYFLPFLAFLASKVMKFDRRAAIITRGGLAPLYQSVAAQGYDLYALRDYSDVRRENLEDQIHRYKGKTIKQLQVTEWDEAVIDDAAKALGISGAYQTVHPAMMYWALSPYWDEQVGFQYLASMTDYKLLPKIEFPGAPKLPEKFVAVKCYGRATFPYPHPDVVEWTKQTIATIAAQCPVITLSSDTPYDDHSDIPMSGPNILTLPPVAPEQNLLLQAAVMAKATAFVGTYGGVAQLALRMGVPSVSVYHEFGGTAFGHLALSQRLSHVTKVPFLTASIADCLLWRQIVSLPGVPMAVAPEVQPAAEVAA